MQQPDTVGRRASTNINDFAGLTYLAIGTVLPAFFDAVYLGAQLGAGPRDGIMTGLTRITKQPVRRVRTGIEVTVATLGWFLGGTLRFAQ